MVLVVAGLGLGLVVVLLQHRARHPGAVEILLVTR